MKINKNNNARFLYSITLVINIFINNKYFKAINKNRAD